MGFETGAMGNAALALQVGGALTSTVGSFFGAQTQATNLNTQANIADINARISEMGAQSSLEQGKQQKASLTLQTKQLKGRQRATMAANGVDLGTGSAAEIQASTDLMKEIDVGTIKTNAVRTAWGHRTQAVNYQNQARMARSASSGINPLASAATTLLGSAGNVASNWYVMNKAGMFDAPKFDSIDAMAADKGWW